MKPKPYAVIVDLDDTIALFEGKRGPYDGHLCSVDDVCEVTRYVVQRLWATGTGWQPIYLSSRNESAREPTADWLRRNGFPEGPILLRGVDDWRTGLEYKLEQYKVHIAPAFNAMLALEDDPDIVSLWRSLGIICYQVREHVKVIPPPDGQP